MDMPSVERNDSDRKKGGEGLQVPEEVKEQLRQTLRGAEQRRQWDLLKIDTQMRFDRLAACLDAMKRSEGKDGESYATDVDIRYFKGANPNASCHLEARTSGNRIDQISMDYPVDDVMAKAVFKSGVDGLIVELTWSREVDGSGMVERRRRVDFGSHEDMEKFIQMREVEHEPWYPTGAVGALRRADDHVIRTLGLRGNSLHDQSEASLDLALENST